METVKDERTQRRNIALTVAVLAVIAVAFYATAFLKDW